MILFGLLIWLCFGFFVVKLNEEAAILRFGCLNRTGKPGLNWRLPWPIEAHKVVDVTTLHKITVTTDNDLVLTNDENMLSVQFTIFWRVKNIANYLFKAKSPDEIVESAAEAVMRQIISNTHSQEALTAGRQEIANQIKTNLQRLLNEYMIGIEIVDAQIGKIDPPEPVIGAYREVLKAKLDGETKKNEAESYANYIVPKAEGEAYELYSEAKTIEASVLANAEGDRDSYLSLLSAYEMDPFLTEQIMSTQATAQMLKDAKVSILDKNVPVLLYPPSKE
jgi:membrane protease subunit HflK